MGINIFNLRSLGEFISLAIPAARGLICKGLLAGIMPQIVARVFLLYEGSQNIGTPLSKDWGGVSVPE